MIQPATSTTAVTHRVIVVIESDNVVEMAQAAIEELGKKLRNERAVKAQARRFAKKLAADPSPFRIQEYDVVGYCAPDKSRPNRFEPIVIHDGKPVPVSLTYIAESGDYWVSSAAELDRTRDRAIAACARQLAEQLALCEAMFQAAEQADPESTLGSYSCDPRRNTVELSDDPDGTIAKRLPRWITVRADDEDADNARGS